MNNKYKETQLKNRERRKNMVIRSFECSLRLSKTKKKQLDKMFLEAKWLYNWLLDQEDIFNLSKSFKTDLYSYDKDKNKIKRELTILSAGSAGDYIRQIRTSVLNLSKAKKKGYKVGKLKFKSNVITLSPRFSLSNDFKYYKPEFKVHKGFKNEYIRCYGLKKLPKDAEIFEVKLLKRCGTYKIQVQFYTHFKQRNKTNKCVGLDFGIKDTLVSSDGQKFKFTIEKSEQNRCKKIQKQLSRSVKGSNNRLKLCYKLQKASNRIHNIKKDYVNKLLHNILKEYDIVVIQDESIKAWQAGWFGKQVHNSVLGMIKSKLLQKQEENNKTKQNDIRIINRWLPTTAMCPACGKVTKQSLDKRIFVCECGYHEDRDIHAAKNILKFGIGSVGSEFKSVENHSSANISSFNFSKNIYETENMKSDFHVWR